MVDYQTISVMFTGLSISLAAFYYISTLRNAQRNQKQQLETRQAQLFMPLFETYRNREFRRQIREILDQEWDDYIMFLDKYGPANNPEAFATRVAVSSYFDGIGVLLRKDLVETGMVNDLIGNSIIDVWEKVGGHFLETRKRIKNPFIYTDFEYLYKTIKKHRELHPQNSNP